MGLTLDEAIKHAREVAERNRLSYKNCTRHREDIEHQTCEQCAEEHEQLVEWLEDYQRIKKWKDEIIEDFCRYDVSSFEELVQKVRNKAIDDFINQCKRSMFTESDEIVLSDIHQGCNSGLSMAIHFAEQLKEGCENKSDE